jgi:two-component system, NarL family, nitrate/nitrite response regulator NarL
VALQDAVTETDEVAVPIAIDGQRRSGGSRVLVIVNNLLIAEVLVSALTQGGFETRFATGTSGTELREFLAWRPHVAVLEIDPDDKGASLELIRSLHRMDVATAVLGGEIDSVSLVECVDAGVSAVIDTRSALKDFIGVLGRLTVGHLVTETDPPRSMGLSQRASAARLAPFAVLTAREKSVLAELMGGHRAETIAKNAWVSISTVRSQIKAILQKLGVNSQLAAVAMARDAGWDNDVLRSTTSAETLESA